MNCSTFASLAQIQILLLPVGSISRSTFETWARTIRSSSEIRLSDVQGDSKDDTHRFMPKPLESGFLLLSYPSHPPPHSRFSLGVFRPSSFPMGVIGIASCSPSDSISAIYTDYNSVISDIFPDSSIFPFAKSCFIFEEGDGHTSINMQERIPDVTIIPSMMGNKDLYVGTLISELCSNILGGFSSFISVLETAQGNQAMNSGMLANVPNFVAAQRLAEVNSGTPPLHSQNSYPGSLPTNEPLDVSRIPLKRTSTASSGNSLPTSRSSLGVSTTKKRQSTIPPTTSHARLYKVLGDLFLLAGRLMDASIWYNEAIALLKQPSDILWHASALEGIATANVVEIWTNFQNSTDLDIAKDTWVGIAEKLAQAASLYAKAATSVDGGDCLTDISYLYISAALRHSIFLHKIASCSGWKSHTLNSLIHSTHISRIPFATRSRLDGEDAPAEAATTMPSRSDISASLSLAHGPWLLHLGPREKIDVLRLMVNLYESLSYRRKQAYVLRELISCVMDLFVHGREETKGTSVVSSRTSLDGRGERVLREDEVGIREAEDGAGNSSIIQLVKYVCKIHGVDLGCVQFSDGSKGIPTPSLSSCRSRKSIVGSHFGWPELQIGLVREALAIAEGLPDYVSVVQFALSALKDQECFLDGDDQYHFHVTASRAIAILRRRGDERKMKHWAGSDIVSSIKQMPLSPMRMPSERSSRELDPDRIASSTRLSSASRSSNTPQHLIVQNESAEFVLTMCNPFAFALEITHLTLSTSGVPFRQDGCSITIPGYSSQTITLSGKAAESGILTIRGCFVQLSGSDPCEITVPVLSEEEEYEQLNRLIASENDARRPKILDLNHRLNNSGDRAADTVNLENSRYLDIKVIPDQPLLRIKRTSLTNGAVMLYDGETITIRVSLENISEVAVDFFDLQFDDTAKALQELALSDSQLDAFDAYESEYSLVRMPVLSWDRQTHKQTLLPGTEMTVEVKCFGKSGCSRGLIDLIYAHTKPLTSSSSSDSPARPPSVYYARQLSLPLLVSVYEMLECHALNVVPIPSPDNFIEDSDDGTDIVNEAYRHALLARHDDSEWCMLVLEVGNKYGLAFEVRTTCDGVSTSRVIPPGLTYRLMLPIKRVFLSDEIISKPIPSLTGRQYVLPKKDSAMHRELFWYREELLSRVHVSWKEAAGSRKGKLSLRKQHFSTEMLCALRKEQVVIRLSLSESNGGKNAQHEGTVQPNKFVCLEACIENHASLPLTITLSLDVEPVEYVLFEGMLNDVPIGHIDAGSSSTTSLSLVFLAEGDYKITAQARLIEAERQTVSIRGGRREMTVHAVHDKE